MVGMLRPARDEEVSRLWPAVRAARLFPTPADFSAYRDAGPWRVRVSDSGEALVLGEWRRGQDLLWIKGIWGAVAQIPALVSHARTVARGQGFRRVLSPLLSATAFEPYADAGMTPLESLVAIQAYIDALYLHPSTRVAVRTASDADVPELLRVDALCFEPFWRYGSAELATVAATERLTVATSDGRVVGYATMSMHGGSATLGRIAVAPDSRGQGVGQALVSEQTEHARRGGALTMTLCTQESNATARAFYRRCGMSELPERYVLGVRDA